MEDIDAYRLGESPDTIDFTSAAENRAIAAAMAAQARRTLYLSTSDLDPQVYDCAAFVEATARMAREHSRSRVLVLVQDSMRTTKEGHRLVRLAQHLSSRVALRNPAPDDQDLLESVLIADEVGLIRHLIPGRHEGTASFHAPLQARELARRFEAAWERALPDPQLRRLHL